MSKQRFPSPFIPTRPGGAVALLVAAGLALFAALGASAPADLGGPDRLHLVVLHTNDVHGQALPRVSKDRDGEEQQVGGLGRVAEYVAGVRAAHVGTDDDGTVRAVLMLDGGDWWQGTPEGALDDGVPFVRALAGAGYDAMTLGNHEFDLGLAPLRRILTESGPPALTANLRTAPDGPRVDWLEPWRVVDVAGVKIALVGLVGADTPYITHPEARTLHFEDEVVELGRVLEELPDDVDLVIPMTHSGVETDRRLAAAYPELPLIVGGHSHTFLPSGVRVGDTLIVQAGAKAACVGHVDLIVEGGRVVESNARLAQLERPSAEPVRNTAVAEQVEELARRSEAALGEQVGVLGGPLADMQPFGSSSVGNWIADSFRRGIESDLSVHNRGGIRKRLEPGALTRRDLFELLPFPNTLVTIELTGAELFACFERATVGRERSRLEISGARLLLELDDDGVARSLRIVVGGEPLDRDATYTVATNSYLAAGGDRLFDLERELPQRDTGILLRELLERDLRAAEGAFVPDPADRYSISR